jgi:hypothetical protein
MIHILPFQAPATVERKVKLPDKLIEEKRGLNITLVKNSRELLDITK